MKTGKKIILSIISLVLCVAFSVVMASCGKKAQVNVTFDSNGGTEIASVKVEKDSTLENPTDPIKVGYTFDGWYLGEEEFSFSTPITSDITLKAKWTANDDTAYVVKHLQEKLDGGYEEVTADRENLTGTTDTDTNAVAKTYVGFTAKTVTQVKIAGDGSTVVEIKYDRNLIKITWVVDGVPTTEDYKYGALPTIANPEKDADNTYTYAFSNWDTEIVVATEAKTYTAVFTPTYIDYTVIFKNYDGTELSKKTDYHYGDTIVVPTSDPVKQADNTYSYSFDGWNNAETVTGNLEYVASFTPNYINYTVTFNDYNDEEITSKTDYHYGDTVTIPNHSENLPGYEYGWDKEVVAVDGNKVYTETKTPKTYNVTLQTNGAESGSSLTSYVYSVGATLPNDLIKTGYDFNGWYVDNEFNGDAVTNITTTDIEDKTFYAKWTPKTYNVTLVLNGGTAESELTSYVYTVGATLPNAEKLGYDFDGWFDNADFDGEVVTEISTTDIEDKTFYASFTARNDTKYSVKVLAAQYAQDYAQNFYFPGTLSYVDRTADYRAVFGLDENFTAQGVTDSVIDLSSKVATLKGAKLNDTSIASGTIKADGSLELTIKLDFDEEVLGFGMDDIKIGEWSCDSLLFTLEYKFGVCGLNITGNIGNGKELHINLGEVDLTSYGSYSLGYYQKSAKVQANVSVVNGNDVASSEQVMIAQTLNPTDYVNGSFDVITKFPTVTTLKTIKIKVIETGQVPKDIFITGITKKEFVKKTVTYSVENGNILDIVTPLNNGTIETVESYHFSNTTVGQELDITVPALKYTYQSEEAISANHTAGVIFDLGGAIKVSDYKTIKVVFEAKRIDGTNSNAGFIYGNNKTNDIASLYGGGHEVDVKASCIAKGISNLSELEISLQGWAGGTSYVLYVSSIVLELNDADISE